MPGAFPLVKGTALRATKINSCGMPVAGPRNRLVTKGFVTATLTPVMRDAEDLEQVNAEGRVCVSDRTPPERRWYTAAIELCNVNPGLITMFTGWESVLDAADLPVGFRDSDVIESDYGIALEIWTSGKSEDDCGDAPTRDSVFTAPGSGRKYGYFLFGGTEWTLGDIAIGSTVATLTLTGRTIAMPWWGRGPYNVAAAEDGTAARLLVPTSAKEHLTVFRTPIAPPEPTEGNEPVALATSTIFTAPDFYYGGPADEPEADVAPPQAA
ncbi:major tail protein [Mycobacterium phage Thonko]|uniref:Major tail protein n=1 Tax=Mycobacterium phage Thonko TaxID=2282910 RepID=A0A346FC66_9CAUD|nr:major tail protein [Mycobacterium phage Thonko]AXN53291.1 major tail protein [Mycobacterium phage Thonko]